MNIPPIEPDDTRPDAPVVGLPLRLKRRFSPLSVFLAALLFPLFCCGLTLLVYLVVPPPRVNILILGVDGHGEEAFVSRTDSIMLLGIEPSHLRTSILSIPRDLFIEVPGYGEQRINTINVLGEEKQKGSGPNLLAASLAQDFGIS